MDLRLVVHTVLEDYALPKFGTHGVSHRARVLENGLRLAQATGADTEVIQLFAVLHDAKRWTEGTDPGHGARAAEYAAELRGDVFELPDDRFRPFYDGRAYSQSYASLVSFMAS